MNLFCYSSTLPRGNRDHLGLMRVRISVGRDWKHLKPRPEMTFACFQSAVTKSRPTAESTSACPCVLLRGLRTPPNVYWVGGAVETFGQIVCSAGTLAQSRWAQAAQSGICIDVGRDWRHLKPRPEMTFACFQSADHNYYLFTAKAAWTTRRPSVRSRARRGRRHNQDGHRRHDRACVSI